MEYLIVKYFRNYYQTSEYFIKRLSSFSLYLTYTCYRYLKPYFWTRKQGTTVCIKNGKVATICQQLKK